MSDATEGGGPEGGGPDGGEGRRRRRRRRGAGGEGGQAAAPPPANPQPQPQPPRGPRPERRDERGGGRGPRQEARRDDRGNRGPRPEPPARGEQRRDDRGNPQRPRDERRRDERPRDDRPREARDDRPREARDDRPREAREARDDRRPAPAPVDNGWDEDASTSGEAAATTPVVDDDGPAPPVTLGPDLPDEPPLDDLDPASADAAEVPASALGEPVAAVLGVRLQTTGKVFWCDAGTGDYKVGDLVVVESERSTRLATVAVPPTRKAVNEKLGRVVLRKANDADRAGQAREHARADEILALAKARARELRLPAKMFRVEYTQSPGPSGKGGKLNLYFTSDERVEMRDVLRELGNATGARIELRQVGVRDEAKHVGGIGSCGQELCCTTWLPDFVPVSIKMAKDQGLVLNPTKVSGQCGRLKCCLVYEQATYAEMRKGLPKLGKRVITASGEGRVVEVDVLRQRVRVAFGPGESQVMPANEVKPMFPAQQPGGRGATDADAETETDAENGSDTEATGETEPATETDTDL